MHSTSLSAHMMWWNSQKEKYCLKCTYRTRYLTTYHLNSSPCLYLTCKLLFVISFVLISQLRFKHAGLGTHLSNLGCLSRTVGWWVLLVVSKREEGIVALQVPTGPLNPRMVGAGTKMRTHYILANDVATDLATVPSRLISTYVCVRH